MSRLMSRIIVVFLSLLFCCRAVFARDEGCPVVLGNASVTNVVCGDSTQYIKCARLPIIPVSMGEGNSYLMNSNGECYDISDCVEIDNNNWMCYRDKMPVYGTAKIVNSTKMSAGDMYRLTVDCTVTSPFNAVFNITGYATAANANNASRICNSLVAMSELFVEEPLMSDATALDGDVCPDGFYTVPYETTCGEGMFNIADVPNCMNDTSGEYCLMPVSDPCDVISDCGEVSFTNDGNGKYALKYTACSGGKCAQSETQVSACGNGYYGDGITCTRCPQNIMSDIPTYTDNGNGALIINANAREERDCYVTPEMKFNDLSGSYSYESNCSYAPGYVY